MGIVKYNRVVFSEAMSKSPNQSGISFSKVEYPRDCIKIESINPKMNDITSHLSIAIPIEHLDDVINSLIELRTDLNK